MAWNTILLLVWSIIGYQVYYGISCAIVIEPTKSGLAKQTGLPWLDKPSNGQSSPVRPSLPSLMGPRSCPKAKKTEKAKKTKKTDFSNHGTYGLGVPWLLRSVFFVFLLFLFFCFWSVPGGEPIKLA